MIWGQRGVGAEGNGGGGVFLGQLRAYLIWAASNESSSQECVATGPVCVQNKVFHQRSASLSYPLLVPLFAWLCAYLPGLCNGNTYCDPMLFKNGLPNSTQQLPTAKIQQSFCWQVFCGLSFPVSEEEENNQSASTLVLKSQQILGRFAQCTTALWGYNCKPLTRDEKTIQPLLLGRESGF